MAEGRARGPEGLGGAAGARWIGAGGVFAVVFAALLEPYLGLVAAAARHMPVHALGADYIAGVVWAAALGATILAWPVRADDRLLLAAAWVVKCAVTLGFMLAYEWNYDSLDAYGYFATALGSSFDWSSIGFGLGTENMHALAWAHSRVIPGSYHAIKVTLSMCGLIGVYVCYRAAVVARGREDRRILCGLVLLPSILFWSSIFGKDPLMLLAIAIYAYGAVSWARRGRAGALGWVAVGTVFAAFIRLWLGPILLGPFFVLVVLRARPGLSRLVWLAAGGAGLAAAVALFWQRLAIEGISELISTTNYVSQGWASGGSAQVRATEFSGIGSMVAFLPIGIFTALFRPLPGEVMNAFGVLAGAENAVLVWLLVLACVRTRLRDFRDPVVVWAGSLILTWAALYSFLSYQNLGTAVRFRLQILPVLLLWLLHLSRRRGPRPTPPAAG